MDPIEIFLASTPIEKSISFVKIRKPHELEEREIRKLFHWSMYGAFSHYNDFRIAQLFGNIVGVSIPIHDGTFRREIIAPKDELFILYKLFSSDIDVDLSLYDAVYFGHTPKIEVISAPHLQSVYNRITYGLL